jgi:hypothetical protein
LVEDSSVPAGQLSVMLLSVAWMERVTSSSGLTVTGVVPAADMQVPTVAVTL